MAEDPDMSALSKQGASKGGQSRARNLTPTRRSEIARQAALARWGSDHKFATHEGVLRIGPQEISCAVLEDGTRVVSQSTMLTALGRHAEKSRRGEEKIPPFLSAGNLQPFIRAEVWGLAEPISYTMVGGGRALGYRAELLPEVCDVYLSARSENAIVPSQRQAARAAEILVRGLAKVGIVALVDEATGYQESRARQELQQILNKYIAPELQPWTKRFGDDFFEQIYRLQGWEFRPGTAKRSPYVGKLVNKYIYEQLPPGVLDELRARNPKNERGNRPYRFHQLLTSDTGHPHLDKQISGVTMLMRVSDSKEMFEQLFERAYPPREPRLPLQIDIPPKNAD